MTIDTAAGQAGRFDPPDVKMTAVSWAVGDSQIVEDMVISFTHTTEIDWMLPGIQPTGKPVEAAFVVVVEAVVDAIIKGSFLPLLPMGTVPSFTSCVRPRALQPTPSPR
jgi:hypothetical protein